MRIAWGNRAAELANPCVHRNPFGTVTRAELTRCFVVLEYCDATRFAIEPGPSVLDSTIRPTVSEELDVRRWKLLQRFSRNLKFFFISASLTDEVWTEMQAVALAKSWSEASMAGVVFTRDLFETCSRAEARRLASPRRTRSVS